MSLIKKSIVLAKDTAKGLLNIVRLGGSVAARLLLNEPPKGQLWAALRVGQNPQINLPALQLENNYSMDIDLKITDSIGVILMDSALNIYAFGGIKDMINLNLLKDAILESKISTVEETHNKSDTQTPIKEETIVETQVEEVESEPIVEPINEQPQTTLIIEETIDTPKAEEDIVIEKPPIIEVEPENDCGILVEDTQTLMETEPKKPTKSARKKQTLPDPEVEIIKLGQTVENNVEVVAVSSDLQKKNNAEEINSKGEDQDMNNSYKKAKERLNAEHQRIQREKLQRQENDNKNPFDIPGSENFYQSIRSRLDEILTVNPREESLEKIIPDSRWVKVKYEKDDYYVVGVLTENNTITHIAYGVPGISSVKPPKEAQDLCDFLPVKNSKAEGYWLMFQDAKDGKLLKNI